MRFERVTWADALERDRAEQAAAATFDAWRLERVKAGGGPVLAAVLYRDYLARCEADGIVEPLSKQGFGRRLGRLYDRARGTGGVRVYRVTLEARNAR